MTCVIGYIFCVAPQHNGSNIQGQAVLQALTLSRPMVLWIESSPQGWFMIIAATRPEALDPAQSPNSVESTHKPQINRVAAIATRSSWYHCCRTPSLSFLTCDCLAAAARDGCALASNHQKAIHAASVSKRTKPAFWDLGLKYAQ